MNNKNTFYSQHGEDFILNEIFKGKSDGFFVEVGCIDGMRFSNTLFFEQNGWMGLCIEAHPTYIPMLVKNRPNSIVEWCAVGEAEDDNAIFFANSRGSLSSLDKSREAYFRGKYGKYFTGFEKKYVKKRTLDSLFEANNIKNIDILSIDIEGYEKYALQGITFENYNISVIVVEADLPEDKRDINKILTKNNYNFHFSIASNLFYFNTNIDGDLLSIKDKYEDVHLCHTEHPLDNDGNKDFITNVAIKRKLFIEEKEKVKVFFKKIYKLR